MVRREETRRDRRIAPRALVYVVALVAAALLLVGSPRQAEAQEKLFYLDRLQLGGMQHDGFTVWRPEFGTETSLYASIAAGYALNPLRASTVTKDTSISSDIGTPIQNLLIAYGFVGVNLLGKASFGISLPVEFVQTGSDHTGSGVGNGFGSGVAAYDVRLDGRVQLYQNDARTFRVGFFGALFTGTGKQDSFASDGIVTGMLLGSLDGNIGPLIISGMVGPDFRPERSIFGSDLWIGNELRYAGGVYVPMRDDAARVGVEIWGSLGISSDPNGDSTFLDSRNSTVEWLAQGRFALNDAKSLYLQAGAGTRLSAGYGSADFRAIAMFGGDYAPQDSGIRQTAKRRGPIHIDGPLDTDGDGYPDSIDKCIEIPEDGVEPTPYDGCPALDRDNDGVGDVVDDCPEDPEDRDGIRDKDGCPEDDADRDSILDVSDACPLKPGLRSADPKQNGCPTTTRYEEDTGEIILLQPIQFQTGKATIKSVSFPILDEVVAIVQSNPRSRLAVHGHTDSRGGRNMNLRLSQARAESVVRYLQSQGIDAKRMESAGFGPDRPVDTNSTKAGRAHNRRVEFKLLNAGDVHIEQEIELD